MFINTLPTMHVSTEMGIFGIGLEDARRHSISEFVSHHCHAFHVFGLPRLSSVFLFPFARHVPEGTHSPSPRLRRRALGAI